MLDDPALERVPGDSQELGRRNDAAGRIQRGDAESPLCGGEVIGVQNDGDRAHARTDCRGDPPILVMAVRHLAFLGSEDSYFVGVGLRQGQMQTVVSDTAPCRRIQSMHVAELPVQWLNSTPTGIEALQLSPVKAGER